MQEDWGMKVEEELKKEIIYKMWEENIVKNAYKLLSEIEELKMKLDKRNAEVKQAITDLQNKHIKYSPSCNICDFVKELLQELGLGQR